MNNKEELKKEIDELPLFDKRDIQVKHATDERFVGCEGYKAICQVDMWQPYAFVGNGYNLVQFHEVFHPILDAIEGEVKGRIINYNGFAAMVMFPEDEALVQGDSKFGLIAMNSVDCSSAVVLKFCVDHKGRRISIPAKVAGIKKTHRGKVVDLVRDYSQFLGSVKDAWTFIIENFPKMHIVEKINENDEYEHEVIEFDTVVKKWGFGSRLTKKLKKDYDYTKIDGKEYTLWDLFVDALDKVSSQKYKSDVHKQKNIDKLCNSVFEMRMIAAL
jgi:hypothetical protein